MPTCLPQNIPIKITQISALSYHPAGLWKTPSYILDSLQSYILSVYVPYAYDMRSVTTVITVAVYYAAMKPFPSTVWNVPPAAMARYSEELDFLS